MTNIKNLAVRWFCLLITVQISLPLHAEPTALKTQQMITLADRYAAIIQAKNAKLKMQTTLSAKEKNDFKNLQKHNLEQVLQSLLNLSDPSPERPASVQAWVPREGWGELRPDFAFNALFPMLGANFGILAALLTATIDGDIAQSHPTFELFFIPAAAAMPILFYNVIDPLQTKYRNYVLLKKYNQLLKAWEASDAILQPFYERLRRHGIAVPVRNPKDWLLRELASTIENPATPKSTREIKAQLRKYDEQLKTWQAVIADDMDPRRQTLISDLRKSLKELGLQDPWFPTQKQFEHNLESLKLLAMDYQEIAESMKDHRRVSSSTYLDPDSVMNEFITNEEKSVPWTALLNSIDLQVPANISSEAQSLSQDFLKFFKENEINSPTLQKILNEAAVQHETVFISISPQAEIQSRVLKSRLARLNFHMEIQTPDRSPRVFDFPFRYFMMDEKVMQRPSATQTVLNPADLPSILESLNLQFEDAIVQSAGYVPAVSPFEVKTTAAAAPSCQRALEKP